MSMTVWQSPSGRLHGMRRCSGAAAVSRMKRRKITRPDFDTADRCRCLQTFREDVR